MPRVPIAERRVGLARQPVPQTDPRAFRSVGQELSRGVGQIADAGTQLLIERQERMAKEADIAFVNASDSTLYEGDAAFYRQQGNGVAESLEPSISALREQKRVIGERLDGVSAQLFNETAERRIAAETRKMRTHALNVERDLTVKASEAREAQQINVVARNALDDTAVTQAMNTGLAEIQDRAEILGWDADRTKLARENFLSHAHTSVIKSRLQANPAAAKRYFDAAKGELSARAIAELEPKVDLRTKAQSGLLLFDSIWDPEGDETAMLNEIRRRTRDPAVRDDALARMRRAVSDRDAAETRLRQQHEEEGWRAVFNGEITSPEDIPIEYDVGLQRALRAELGQLGKAVNQAEQDARLDELLVLAEEKPQEFAREPLSRHARVLGRTNTNFLESMQDRMTRDGVDAPGGFTSMITTVLDEIGEKDNERRAAFKRNAIRQWVELREKKGEDPTFDEEEGLLDALILEGETPNRTGFGGGADIRLFQLQPGETFTLDNVNVPQDAAVRIAASLRRRGLAPTAERVLDEYLRAQGQRDEEARRQAETGISEVR